MDRDKKSECSQFVSARVQQDSSCSRAISNGFTWGVSIALGSLLVNHLFGRRGPGALHEAVSDGIMGGLVAGFVTSHMVQEQNAKTEFLLRELDDKYSCSACGR